MEKRINLEDKNIVNALFEGAYLTEFVFHTGFRLKFSCEAGKTFGKKEIPHEVNLYISSNWRFGSESEWKNTVQKLVAGCNFIEPEEPVLAYKLAAIMWNGNAKVQSVDLTDESLKLNFENGEFINISNFEEPNSECAWEISNTNVFNDDNKDIFCVFCDKNGIFSETYIKE